MTIPNQRELWIKIETLKAISSFSLMKKKQKIKASRGF